MGSRRWSFVQQQPEPARSSVGFALAFLATLAIVLVTMTVLFR